MTSMQPPGQAFSGAGQVVVPIEQTPDRHSVPAGHTRPHMAQFPGSRIRSVQRMVPSDAGQVAGVFAGQAGVVPLEPPAPVPPSVAPGPPPPPSPPPHLAFTQAPPAGQITPQLPQFMGSPPRLVQTGPCGPGQTLGAVA
ncbi:MAG: hypothetical protein ABIW57_05700, partial [Polyangia bacterium]